MVSNHSGLSFRACNVTYVCHILYVVILVSAPSVSDNAASHVACHVGINGTVFYERI